MLYGKEPNNSCCAVARGLAVIRIKFNTIKPRHPLLDKYVDERWNVTWPDDPQERNDLANLLIGAQIVNTMNWCATSARDLLQTPTSYEPAPYLAIPPDAQYRDVLINLSDEQKIAVSRLLDHCLAGMVHKTAITFDLSMYGPIFLKLVAVPMGEDESEKEQEIDALPMNGCDYSFDSLLWLELFSNYKNRRF